VPRDRKRQVSSPASKLAALLRWLLLAALLLYGYSLMPSSRLPESVADWLGEYRPPEAKPIQTRAAGPVFECDGRKTCDEMTSCAEARYFVAHCPNVQMDPNRIGGPCKRLCD